MRLVDKMLGRPEGQLPSGRELRGFESPRGAGRYFAEDTTLRAKQALENLETLPNADRETRSAVIASALAIIDTARELDALDGALAKASNGWLSSALDDSIGYESRVRMTQNEPKDGIFSYLRSHGGAENTPLVRWIFSLPEAQAAEMQVLADRRKELREAISPAHTDFRQTTEEIAAAAQKMQAYTAAASVDRDDVATTHPELGLTNVARAQELVTSVSAGLDEAYGHRPELSGLETPSVFTPATSTSAEIER
jgi:hypothetical protein